jgi:threonyl-tRNA synthetase
MLRNRTYTSDITHCFCPAESMQKELIYSLQLLVKIIKIFGFEVQWNLRTRRSHSTVNAGDWDAGVKALRAAAQTIGLPVADVEAPGPMQGPRLEALFQDALGQVWSGSFIQIDCCHPRLLKLSCEGKGKHAGTPKMIALSVWGSLERMAALLVENHPGMPQWPAILAEVQRKITSINEESISPIES